MTPATFRRMLHDVFAEFHAQGVPIKGARIHSDGSVELLTQDEAAALASDDLDVVDLAGASEIHRAQRA